MERSVVERLGAANPVVRVLHWNVQIGANQPPEPVCMLVRNAEVKSLALAQEILVHEGEMDPTLGLHFEIIEHLSPANCISTATGFRDDTVLGHDGRSGEDDGQKPEDAAREVPQKDRRGYGGHRVSGVEHEDQHHTHEHRGQDRQTTHARRNPGHLDTAHAQALHECHSQEHARHGDERYDQDGMQRIDHG